MYYLWRIDQTIYSRHGFSGDGDYIVTGTTSFGAGKSYAWYDLYAIKLTWAHGPK